MENLQDSIKDTNQTENLQKNSVDKAAAEKEVEDKKKEGKKKMLKFLIGIVIVAVLFFIYYLLFMLHYEETENAYIHGNQVSITSQVSGMISEIDVQDTQTIKKGQPAIKIDSTDYEIALNNAKANLAEAVRNYYKLQNNVAINRENFELSEKTYKRVSISYKAGITSTENYNNATFAYETNKIKLEDSILAAKSTSIYTHPLVAQAIQNLTKAYNNLEKTRIASPISGVIAQKRAELGQQVGVGQGLFTVVDLNDIWINANFKETQLGKIKRGNSVKIVSDLNGKTYEGVVSGLAAGSGSAFALIPTQNATGNWIKIVQRVPVRIDILKESLEKNGVLPIGTSTTVTVDTNKFVEVPEMFTNQVSTLYEVNKEELNALIEKIIVENSL